MPNPTRAQVEAYLSSLPEDQQGPALEEIKKRWIKTPEPTAYELAARGYGGQGSNPIIGADPKTKAIMSGLLTGVVAPEAAGALIPSLPPTALAALGGGAAAAVEGSGLKGILAGALTGGALSKIGKVWKLAKMLGIAGPSASELSASAEPTLQELIKIKNEAAAAGSDVENSLTKWLRDKMAPPEAFSGTQGEMQTMVGKMSSPPAGYVESPSLEAVSKGMTPPVPKGVNPQDVADWQKYAGGTWEDAIKAVQKSAIGKRSIVLSSTPAPTPQIPVEPSSTPMAPAPPPAMVDTVAPTPVAAPEGSADFAGEFRKRAFSRPNGPTDAEWQMLGGSKAKRAWLDATGRTTPTGSGKEALTPTKPTSLLDKPGAAELNALIAKLLGES